MRRAAIALVAASIAASGSAQQRRPPPSPAPPLQELVVPEPPPQAYEPELLRLAEVLGTLSYLSALCGQPGSEGWSERMSRLVEAEGTTVQRKERLAGAYNRGYIGHQPAHRTCSDRSRQAVERLIQKGQRLTRDIAMRYTG